MLQVYKNQSATASRQGMQQSKKQLVAQSQAVLATPLKPVRNHHTFCSPPVDVSPQAAAVDRRIKPPFQDESEVVNPILLLTDSSNGETTDAST